MDGVTSIFCTSSLFSSNTAATTGSMDLETINKRIDKKSTTGCGFKENELHGVIIFAREEVDQNILHIIQING
jgi:hypothetical protein